MTTKAVVVVGSGATTPQSRQNGTGDGSGPSVVRELLPVANRSLLFHVLYALEDSGIRQAALVVSPARSSAVRAAVETGAPRGIEITYVDHNADGGLADDLERADGVLGGEPFVLHLCDSLAKAGLARLISFTEMSPFDAVLLVCRGSDSHSQRVMDLTNGRLAALVSGGAGADALGTLAGVGVFGPGLVQALRGVDGRSATELQLLAGVERMRSLGGRIEARTVGDWWRFNGQHDPLLEANRFLLEGLPPSHTEAALSATTVQGSVAIDDTACLESSIVRGPAVIGPGVSIRDAYVGPYTAIGADVVIEGAEIENSIILAGARISHLGGRLESSVIGPGARVFRDFKLPRALRLRLGEGAEVSLT